MIYSFPGGAWTVWIGFGLSLATHLTLISLVLLHNPQRPGAIELATEAISVNLETTDILDSVQQSVVTESAPAPATPAERTEQEAKEVPDPDAQPERVDPEPEGPAAEDERPRLAEEALRRTETEERERTEGRARQQRETEVRETERRRRAEAERAQRERREKRKAARASAGASGTRGAPVSAGRISASQGAIGNYKAIVREHVARNKPPYRPARGPVTVWFSLSPSGNLISARVIGSSGNGALDRDALAAIHRGSPFPKPPEGATPRQLVFTIRFVDLNR